MPICMSFRPCSFPTLEELREEVGVVAHSPEVWNVIQRGSKAIGHYEDVLRYGEKSAIIA